MDTPIEPINAMLGPLVGRHPQAGDPTGAAIIIGACGALT